ncbi:MAG: hypothetical protein V3R52_06145 [Candidatus Neomarinimicrobiota bacterium]
MTNWNKKTFTEELRNNCTREVAKVGIELIEFAEKYASNLTWGRGADKGTLTFRCEYDDGLIPLFHLSSDGKINLLINFLRSKDIPKQVIRDIILKLESNFLRDYDEDLYPSDIFENIDDLFHTKTQLEKFLKTMEGVVYRLKQ